MCYRCSKYVYFLSKICNKISSCHFFLFLVVNARDFTSSTFTLRVFSADWSSVRLRWLLDAFALLYSTYALWALSASIVNGFVVFLLVVRPLSQQPPYPSRIKVKVHVCANSNRSCEHTLALNCAVVVVHQAIFTHEVGCGWTTAKSRNF